MKDTYISLLEEKIKLLQEELQFYKERCEKLQNQVDELLRNRFGKKLERFMESSLKDSENDEETASGNGPEEDE